MKTLGILTLGQTPRHDIEQLFTTCMPGVATIIAGGLDNTGQDVIETLANEKSDYPLLVILADTTTRQIPMQHLVPLLEEAAYTLAKQGAEFVVLMCMGNFASRSSGVIAHCQPVSLRAAWYYYPQCRTKNTSTCCLGVEGI